MADGLARIAHTHEGVTRIRGLRPVSAGSTTYLETGDLVLGSPYRIKTIDAFLLQMEGLEDSEGVELYYAVRERLKDPLVWQGPLQVENANEPLYVYADARFLRLKLVDNSPLENWKLSDIQIYGEMDGEAF